MLFILIILIVIFFGGFYFSNKVLLVGLKDESQVYNDAIKNEGVSKDLIDTAKKNGYFIKSSFGYNLYATRIIAKELNEKVVFLSHGVGCNYISSLKYGQIFLELGFDIVLIEHRRHGRSGGKLSTYGFYEKDDIHTIIQEIRIKFPNYKFLGLHGESMGSAIGIQYAGKYNGVDFCIFDCPYSDLKNQLRYRLNVEFKLNGLFIMPLVNLFIYLRAGFKFKDVSPINFAKKIKSPILYIHSKEDKYILPSMSQELLSVSNNKSRLFIPEQGDHAESLLKNRYEYYNNIKEFINNIKPGS